MRAKRKLKSGENNNDNEIESYKIVKCNVPKVVKVGLPGCKVAYGKAATW